MTSNTHQQHCRSFFIPANRPVIPRQRSYSLPPGLALMNAEEATMIFSAAERATLKRRRIASMDTPFTVEDQPIMDSRLSNLSSEGPKAAPVTSQKISANPINAAEQNELQAPREAGNRSPCPRVTGGATMKAALPPIQHFPSSPLFQISPRRLVTSPLLKTYADGLYEYTRTRLTAAVPQFRVGCARSCEYLDHNQMSSAKPAPRPGLESRFSDWSIITGDSTLSRQESRAVTPDPIDSEMMSPGSYFDFLEKTPKKSEVDRSSEITYASSETYDPPSILPPPTPPSHAGLGEDEPSYFSNFDEYLRGDESQLHSQLSCQPETSTINLTPMELLQTIRTSPSSARPSSKTAIRDLSETDIASVGAKGVACEGSSSLSSHFQTANLAIRVPNLLIGAIR
jgi:hypothetical protein